MAEYTFAEISTRWIPKTQKAMDAIVRQSVNDLLKNIPIVTGKGRGGSPRMGEIPRDTGRLAQSLISEVHGGIGGKATGENSFQLVIGKLDAKGSATFSWNTEYAAAVHYGTTTRQGTHWITVAAMNWQGYVENAAKRLAS